MFKFHLCIFNLVIEINIFRNKKKNKTKLSVDYNEEGEGDAEKLDKTPKNTRKLRRTHLINLPKQIFLM